MKPSLTKECKDSFSPERLSTYLSACRGDVDKAMELYLWNMYVAGLFMPLLNLVEVHLMKSFPYLTATQNRATLEKQIDQIRNLRNRIVHHEPIFNRNLIDDYQTIRNFLATCQSPEFLAWLDTHQTIVLIQPRITK